MNICLESAMSRTRSLMSETHDLIAADKLSMSQVSRLTEAARAAARAGAPSEFLDEINKAGDELLDKIRKKNARQRKGHGQIFPRATRFVLPELLVEVEGVKLKTLNWSVSGLLIDLSIGYERRLICGEELDIAVNYGGIQGGGRVRANVVRVDHANRMVAVKIDNPTIKVMYMLKYYMRLAKVL